MVGTLGGEAARRMEREAVKNNTVNNGIRMCCQVLRAHSSAKRFAENK